MAEPVQRLKERRLLYARATTGGRVSAPINVLDGHAQRLGELTPRSGTWRLSTTLDAVNGHAIYAGALGEI